MTFWTDNRFVVTGGAGFLGSAVVRTLKNKGAVDIYVPRSKDYDLRQREAAVALLNDHKPDVIIGDFDSVSTGTLSCGAQLIVHAYPNGKAPGADRLREAGVDFSTFALAGTSEDIAMLLAYEEGAELIVAVGTHVSLVDFMDKGRPGMASTFLTRLKVGPILVDAKGVNKLYRPTVRKRDLTLLILVALAALLMVLAVLPPFQLFWRSLWISFREWRR